MSNTPTQTYISHHHTNSRDWETINKLIRFTELCLQKLWLQYNNSHHRFQSLYKYRKSKWECNTEHCVYLDSLFAALTSLFLIHRPTSNHYLHILGIFFFLLKNTYDLLKHCKFIPTTCSYIWQLKFKKTAVNLGELLTSMSVTIKYAFV